VTGGEVKWERTKDAGSKELVGNNNESRRVEEILKEAKIFLSCSADGDDDNFILRIFGKS
jgi:hypothetical protein